MVTTTRGIVIKYLKYRDTSIIVQVFTEKFGLTSFIVHGIRSPRSKRSIGYFQPFSLLELVAYIKPNRDIQQLSEYKYFAPTHRVQSDIRKSTIALFLCEILGKLLSHEPGEEHESLFEYIATSIIAFDHMENHIENFHLHFLLKIMPHLGLGVSDGISLIRNMELEMVEEDKKLIAFISEILESPLERQIPSSGNLRYRALELILKYYQHHTSQFGEIKSLKVLHQVFQ